MKVTIIQKDNKKVLETYKIFEQGVGYEPSDEDYFSSAWKNAVSDGLVKPEDRDKYDFILS